MSDELEPLGSLARRALAAEQGRPDVDGAMQERLLARVVASVAAGAAVTAVATTAAASASAAAGNAGATAAAGTAAGTTGAAAAGLTIKALPWIIAAFVAGGGAGAAIHAAVAPGPASPPQPSMDVATATAVPARPPASAIASAPPPSLPAVPASALPAAPSVPVVPRPSASTAPAASGGSDLDLASERALVDRARAALSRGQSRDALDALEAHATRYPHGRLSEEREALAVDALVKSGRTSEAQARARRFRATYPNSVFSEVVETAFPPR